MRSMPSEQRGRVNVARPERPVKMRRTVAQRTPFPDVRPTLEAAFLRAVAIERVRQQHAAPGEQCRPDEGRAASGEVGRDATPRVGAVRVAEVVPRVMVRGVEVEKVEDWHAADSQGVTGGTALQSLASERGIAKRMPDRGKALKFLA